MAFGGHFFTDVAAAGLVTFLVIWLAYALDLPLALDPAVGRADRRRADAVGLAGLPPAGERWRGREGSALDPI